LSILRSGVLALALLLAAAPAHAAKVGKLAPKFVIVTYEGEQVPFESLRGKVVILNYWATWCAPCRNEIPEIDRFVRRHPGAPLAVYAVTLDNNVPYHRLRFLADTLKFPLVEKLKGSGYGTIKGAVPTNYVIDTAGVVRYAKAGAFTAAGLEALVAPMLAEPVPQVAAAAAP
jgi:cytochrome c biogenesis protein CcmG/thiol:disulfide interchange protein DsbE